MARKIFSLLISFSLIFQQIGFASMTAELNIAGHLSKMSGGFVQDRFRPAHIRFFSYDARNDNIKVMLDRGDVKGLKGDKLNASTQELLNYFLVGINLPNDKFWVNLRPDSENNIIDDYLARTDVGRIMLEADLQLKKDTAQFTSPETLEGREYWNKLYKKAEELYGYQEVNIPTLTRPWIVPNEIIVREANDSAYIYKATLKVMLEQDFLKDSAAYSFKDARAKELNEYSSQLIRELIIPKLTKEVNLSKRYAALRQVYYSIILSRWFKSHYAGQTGQYASRIDTRDLTGLTSATVWSKTTYFEAYKKSFAQGEYNVKETMRTPTGQVIRTYFSGGMNLGDTLTINGPRTSSPIVPMDTFMDTFRKAGLVAPDGMAITASSPVTINKNFELLRKIPEATKALADRDLTGQNVLIRVNMNVKSKDGVIDDTARLDAVVRIVSFILNNGGTPILYGHNGRLDKKKGKDERQSLEDAANYIQKLFPDIKVVFHKNSVPKDTGVGLQINKSDIVPGAINILENVRFADDYEIGAKRMIFAKSLIALSDGIFIFDAFGDIGSSGASVETVPFLAKEVYTGPAMVEEFNILESMLGGFDALIFGGAKLEKADLLDRLVAAMKKAGFALIGSGPSPMLNTEKKDFLDKLRAGDPERVIIALDYKDQTKFDIGPETIAKFLAKLDTLKAGQTVVYNGTMGFMEHDSGQYQEGTKAVMEKLIELARRGVRIIVIGGDAGSTAKKYGLDREKNVVTFTGGGVPLNILANEPLVGLKALDRRQQQLELKKSTPADTEIKFNVVINGARGRMGLLYLHSLLYDETYSDMRIVALNGVPLEDLDDFIKKLYSPDSTYGVLFPGIDVKVIEKNTEKKYAIIEINSQKILVLNDRKDAIHWDMVGELFGESYLTRLGIIETSGQNLESEKSRKVHLANAGDAIVEFGAPPKDEGTPIVVLSVTEESLEADAQVFSNASCTTNSIAPVANKLHKAFGVKRGVVLTVHAETSDQTPYDTFRGDEPARARPGHKVQSPAKTGAAKLLGKLIEGIGPNDGKAIRVGTLTGSVVIYTAELEKATTAEEVKSIFIQANQDNPRIFGIGHNLSSKNIVKDPHSTIVDLDSIQVSEDGKTIKIATWYDNEWGYAKRGLDTLKSALIKQKEGKRTKDFQAPTKAVKATKEVKVTPAFELEGLANEGALPVFIPAKKSATDNVTDLYLTGIKEKQASRYGQIILRMLLGDPSFNIKAIIVDGIDNDTFDASMKAFAQSIIYSTDLGNLEGVKITPVLTDKDEMYLVFQSESVKRAVRVLPSLPESLDSSAKVLDVTKINYSYLEMITAIIGSLESLDAKLLSAVISMSTRPGGELLDSGKGTSVPANILPVKINELDEKRIPYQAYQVPVNSGSYLFATFAIKGLIDKDAVHKLLKNIPGIETEDTTSSNFVANRSNIILDKSQTLIIPDKKEEVTLVGLFFLVNEELNAANKTLDKLAISSSSPVILRPQVLLNLLDKAKDNPSFAKIIAARGKGDGIYPDSMFGLDEKTVPVIEIRTDSLEQMRIIFRKAKGEKAILKLALNEKDYTAQPSVVIATAYVAAMLEGYKGPIYFPIKADDFGMGIVIKWLRSQPKGTEARVIYEDLLKSAFNRRFGETMQTMSEDDIDESRVKLETELLNNIADFRDDLETVQKRIYDLLSKEHKAIGNEIEQTFINLETETATSSPISDKGGIDFRANAMAIKYEPMGNFASLNLNLPVLNKAELAGFDIDTELSDMERMVEGQIVPSGERLKEALAACSQKGQMETNRERLMVLLVKIGILEEVQCCLQEASNEYKEALVLTDSLT
ncbi:MAG: phosphoglycerate kinase [Candidatus Omnitrophota bacterium]